MDDWQTRDASFVAENRCDASFECGDEQGARDHIRAPSDVNCHRVVGGSGEHRSSGGERGKKVVSWDLVDLDDGFRKLFIR